MRRFFSIVTVLIAIWALAWATSARAAEPESEDEGFSAYSVARLKVFEGSAWVRTPDSGEWEEYSTNTPVPERARVNIPEGSEAELQFHGGQYVLLTGGTEVDVKKFDDQGTSFRLRSGEIRFDLPPDDFAPVKVALPGTGTADFAAPGRYWLNVRDSGDTRLVVRSGEGTVTVERGAFPVKAGQEAVIGRDVRVAAYSGKEQDTYTPPPALTEEEQKAGVPPAAAYELRDYGEWVYSNDYGWVWRPGVAPGWSPYYYGRWAWVSPYGWTWVSNEPWGWYPYHFGWWASDPFFGWIWCPFRSFTSVHFAFGFGTFRHFHRHAFFAPATVRFVRDGRVVRWEPLRPGERFRRSAFTRSDARLARWNRPLERGSVFVRSDGSGGKREWREWSAGQRDRRMGTAERGRNVVVREVRRGQGPAREGAPAVERGIESRPQGPGRIQERPRDRGGPAREGRPGRRSFRAPDAQRPDTGSVNRSGRAPRFDGPGRNATPPARVERTPAPRPGRAEPFVRPDVGSRGGGDNRGGEFRVPSGRQRWNDAGFGRGGGGFDSSGRGGRGSSGGGGGRR